MFTWLFSCTVYHIFMLLIFIKWQSNYCLAVVDLSWNGLSYEGALALGEAIKANKYIRELNVSNNRINWQGATFIANGIKHNDTLEIFKVMQTVKLIIYNNNCLLWGQKSTVWVNGLSCVITKGPTFVSY